MSGYLGNPDAESEHALILADNGVDAARSMLPDPSQTFIHCLDCGDEIPERRRQAIKGCKYCVHCQVDHDNDGVRVRMLDHIL